MSWASSGAIGVGDYRVLCEIRDDAELELSLPPRLDIAAKFTTEARYAGFF